MNKLLLFLLAFVATPCLAASPIIYQGTHSKDLTSQGLITNGLTVGQSAQLTVDPSTGNLVTAGNVVSSLVSTTTTVNAGTAFVGPLLRLKNSSHNMDFVPPTLAADLVFTWPNSVGTVSQVLQTDGSGHLSWVSPVTASPTAYSQAPVAVTAVGTAGFPQLGHVLDAKDFTAPASNQYAFWNLSSTSTTADGGSQGISLTPNGTPTYVTANVIGATGGSAVATLNGTTQYYSSTNAFFSPTAKSFSVDGWFYFNSLSTSPSLFAQGSSTSDRAWELEATSGGGLILAITNTAGSWDQSVTVISSGLLTLTWYRIGFSYNSSAGTAQVFLNGKPIGSPISIATVRSSATPTFNIGHDWAGDFLNGAVSDVAFTSTYTMTADDIRKLAARRIDHNKNIATNNQLWTANWGRSDSTVATQLDASWLVSKSSTSLWADFSGVATGAFVDFSMQNVGQYGTALVPNSTYDSGVLSAAPSTTIAHGLGARPVNIVYQYETTTGHFTPLQGSNFCEADSTNLYCDWTGLSVSASNRLEIIAGGVPLLSAVPLADATTNGIVNSNGAQTIGSAKTFTGLVDASATSGGVKVEVARSSPLVSDGQNVYSGTWTPTITATSGFTTLANVVGVPGSWMRVGNVVTASFQINSGGGTNINGGVIAITGTHPIARASGTGNVAGTCTGATTVALAPPLRITESSATLFTVQSAGGTSSGGTTTWACTYTYTLN